MFFDQFLMGNWIFPLVFWQFNATNLFWVEKILNFATIGLQEEGENEFLSLPPCFTRIIKSHKILKFWVSKHMPNQSLCQYANFEYLWRSWVQNLSNLQLFKLFGTKKNVPILSCLSNFLTFRSNKSHFLLSLRPKWFSGHPRLILLFVPHLNFQKTAQIGTPEQLKLFEMGPEKANRAMFQPITLPETDS